MVLFLRIEWALWLAVVAAEVLLLLRLAHQGLIRKFPFFAAFLLADVVCSVFLMRINVKSRDYTNAYRICTYVMNVFRVGVAGELYERICEHFPGMGRFRIALAAAVVAIAGLVTVFTFRPNLVHQWALPQTIVLVIQRFQTEIFAVVFVLTWIILRFVLSIQQPFRPNVLNHWTIATIYFAVSAAGYLAGLWSASKPIIFPINCAMLGAQFACFVAWFRLMRRSGEELPPFPRLSPDQVKAVEDYNEDLLRTVKTLPVEIAERQAENRDIPVHRGRRN